MVKLNGLLICVSKEEVCMVIDSMKSFKHHQSRTASSIWGVKTQNIKRQYKISEGE